MVTFQLANTCNQSRLSDLTTSNQKKCAKIIRDKIKHCKIKSYVNFPKVMTSIQRIPSWTTWDNILKERILKSYRSNEVTIYETSLLSNFFLGWILYHFYLLSCSSVRDTFHLGVLYFLPFDQVAKFTKKIIYLFRKGSVTKRILYLYYSLRQLMTGLSILRGFPTAAIQLGFSWTI